MKSAIAALAFFVAFGFAEPIPARAVALAPDLGDAESFSVLGAAAMSSANTTTVSGDLGLSPGLEASKTGTWVVGGSEYFGTGGLSESAQADARDAFNDLAGQTPDGLWTSTSPTPGVYNIALDTTFAGTLTLNGDFDDVWVFQIGRDMTFTGDVVMGGDAQPCNVFWQVGRDVTIGSGSNFKGTLIAENDITSASGADISGRLISLTGTTIAMSGTDSSISGPTCLQAATITVNKVVVNDNGGTAVIADFPLFVGGNPVAHGVAETLAPATYTVTETGNAGYAQAFSGACDANGDVVLGAGDTLVCTITNNDIAVVPSPGGGGGSSGGSSPSVPPLIDVLKVPSPLALPGGPGPVTYTYTLTNPGTVPVNDIAMVDDSCSPTTFVSGDTDADSRLDVGETWTYTCSTTLSETRTNIVTATGDANNITAVDTSTATVIVGAPAVPPLIHVTKVPGPLVLPAGGGFVTYTERITNPGTVPLSNITLTDDKCGPVAYVSGDSDGDSTLDVSETWTYTCRVRLAATTTNTATATGEANGIAATDFAITTVVVATSALSPGFPSAGVAPGGSLFLSTGVLLGILILAPAFFLVLRQRTR